jgi:hypothetical protein
MTMVLNQGYKSVSWKESHTDPTHPETQGAQLQSQLLRRWRQEDWKLEVSLGSLQDPISEKTKMGWRHGLSNRVLSSVRHWVQSPVTHTHSVK